MICNFIEIIILLQESPKSETEQLLFERRKNRDLEEKLEKEQEMRTQMVEDAIIRRNKQNHLQVCVYFVY